MPLKYLFIATFADGSTIVQQPEDKSTIDPEKRSQFYDVLQYAEKSPIVRFELKSEDGGPARTFAVDLRDGHFEVNGQAMRMHESDEAGFELIFFRQHTHDFLVSRTENKETRHKIVYRMGWKIAGNQNYQRVMQID